jgi:diguanylate cyclase (GGDEF)-like protein
MASSPDPPYETAPLTRVLGQSELVQDKVAQAASDLSSVNAALKEEIAEGVPLTKVELVLDQSEAIEVRVQEAADELIAVNDALALEVDERHRLEDRLSESTAALSASRTQERKSRHSALHDAITGLPNLTLFNDRLDHGLAQARRHGWRLAVMFIDLDDFKRVNDTHGHKLGDDVLLVIAQRLQAAVRTGDTLCRRSGDEFLLLMLEAGDESNVAACASRITQNISESCEVHGVTLTVKASIGIALYPEDGRSAQDLLTNADAAMYAAKQHKQGPVFHRRASG